MPSDPDELRARAASIEERQREREREERRRERERQQAERERLRRLSEAVRAVDREGLELLAEDPHATNRTPGRLSTVALDVLGDGATEFGASEIEAAAREEIERRNQRQAQADGGHRAEATAGAVVDVSILEVLAGLFVLLALLGGNR